MSSEHMNDTGATRRQFLERCLTAAAGFTLVGVVAPLIEGCESRVIQPPTNNGGGSNTFDVSSLDADGKGLLTTTKGPDGFKMVIIRKSASTYVVLSARCTHASCEVHAPSGGRLSCPCHQSAFDLDGNVLQGPADRPLTKYTATYDPSSNTVTVTT